MNYSMEKEPTVLQDNDLEHYARCPNCYHSGQSCGHNSPWKGRLQESVDQTIRDFYALPVGARTGEAILQRLEQHWNDPHRDRPQSDKLNTALKQVSKYLVLYLLQEKREHPPLFLFESMSAYVEELSLDLAMMMPVVEWGEEQETGEATLTIKKYFVAENESVVKAFFHMCSVFAYHAFGRLPDRIEAYTLADGGAYLSYPKREQLSLSMDYLRLMDGLMREMQFAGSITH